MPILLVLMLNLDDDPNHESAHHEHGTKFESGGRIIGRICPMSCG